MKTQSEAQSESYAVGYRRPPRKYQFRKGQSGNPSGDRKGQSNPPDLRAQLQDALNRRVTVRSGRQQKTYTKGAAGIEQLVDQFAKGDPRARRDLIPLCEKLGVDLTNRKALEGALQDALSAEDEALLEEYVECRIRERLGGDARFVPRLPNPEPSGEAGPVNS